MPPDAFSTLLLTEGIISTEQLAEFGIRDDPTRGKVNRAGKRSARAARATTTLPSSSGCRRASSVWRGNNESSSRNSTP
jgi:hypothetical protein